MLCRLCLKNVTDPINMFDVIGVELQMACILAKYFWFEPKQDDPISTAICNGCWLSVANFHEFYIAVEEAHKLFTSYTTPVAPETEDALHTEPQKCAEDSASQDEKEEHYSLLENNSTDDDDPIKDFVSLNNLPRRSTRVKISAKQSEPAAGKSASLKKQRGRPRTNPTPSLLPVLKSDNFRDPKTKKNASGGEADKAIAEYMQLTCDVCAASGANWTMSQLRIHMKREHGCKGYAVCCNKKFFKRVMLREHIEKHLNPECYKCEECDKVFADKQCIRNHKLIKHQPESVKTFVCDRCPKKFAKAYLLQQHSAIHDEGAINCSYCKKLFSNTRKLNSHINAMHGNYGIMCDICAKVIRGRAAFLRHQQEHNGVSIPKVQCDLCGSWHRDKYSLQKHKRRHNEAGIPHTCHICGKVSPNRSAMLSHQRYVHAAQRVYECGICKKSFKKSITLKEHMAMHTGEVLYNCPYCPKTFNSNANMHSHRKKMHPIEFEENRKKRLGKDCQSIAPAKTTNEPTLDAGRSAIPQMITIKTNENDSETHNILVTTGDFNEEEDGESIIFTMRKQ